MIQATELGLCSGLPACLQPLQDVSCLGHVAQGFCPKKKKFFADMNNYYPGPGKAPLSITGRLENREKAVGCGMVSKEHSPDSTLFSQPQGIPRLPRFLCKAQDNFIYMA